MADTNFYQLKNGEKSDLCKACETMHINNFDPETFMWLLERYDVPYVPAEWNILRDRAYQKDPYKMTGMSVFGKYLSKMKLKQWKNFGWADTERLQAEAEEKAKLYGRPTQDMENKLIQMKEAYERGEINEAQWLTYKEINEHDIAEKVAANGLVPPPPSDAASFYPVNEAPFEQVELPDVTKDLTDDDKIYLATKWGRLYSAADWVSLESLYNQYESSFDLHNADLIAGTKQLCKLDLKGNQALDSGDIESYSKIARSSDALRKSLKFTEAQRKEDKLTDFSCYGQIVAFAEKYNDEDYIRPIDLTIERDIVDKNINDIKNFTKSLIEEDPAIFKMIEQYIKKRENLAEQEEIENNEEYELTDEDLRDYNDSIESQRKIDNDEEGEFD